MKKLRITDDNTGEIILEKRILREDSILIYTNIDDSGETTSHKRIR